MWWLLACQSVDTSQQPPPAAPSVEVRAVTDTGVVSMRLDLSGGPPGARFRLYVSDALTPRRCAVGIQPCVPLVSPWLLATGPAQTELLLTGQPSLAAGTRAWVVLQAVGPRGQPVVSAPVAFVVQSGTSDADGDGATLEAELLAGSDPAQADTDGGGQLDGSELSIGGDPTDASDDHTDEGSCVDGLDGDHDGLMDCEDAQCAEDPACQEQDCLDGVDGDRDGLVDCDDEDCWNGRCARSTISWVVAGDVSRRHESEWQWGTFGTIWRAVDVIGRVRLDYGASQRTCTWRVGSWGHSRIYQRWSGAFLEYPWRRPGGLTVEGGCHVDQDLLPLPAADLFDGGWYGEELDTSQGGLHYGGFSSFWRNHAASESHRGARPRGLCADGRAPVEAWRDADGDGFGMPVRDGAGALGGRWMVCQPLPPGYVARAGDCDDADPSWTPVDVWRTEAGCAGITGADRDGDGVPSGVDRNDLDGFLLGPEPPPPTSREICHNDLDDDGDSLIDCDDLDCGPYAACFEVECTDGVDGEDRDGLRDCADPDCRAHCAERRCADGRDDDGDALVDCEDADCAFRPACAELECDDLRDNDGDGLADCDDDDCWSASCHDVTVAWAVTASFSYQSVAFYGSSSHVARHVVGRVRVEGPDVGVRTCTWSVDRAGRGINIGLIASWQYRRGFEITPGCRVGPEVLPPAEVDLWRHRPWYAPWTLYERRNLRPSSVGMYLLMSTEAEGGPVLHPSWEGQCAGGVDPTLVYDDADGDGFGVSEPRDMHGALGGRRFVCGVVGPGLTQRGGDCDDDDPSWTPVRVVVAHGVDCEALSPDDRDGDGAPASLDLDDDHALQR